MMINILFSQPDELPEPDFLGDRMVILDIPFAMPIAPRNFPLGNPRPRQFYWEEFEWVTLNFINQLGPR